MADLTSLESKIKYTFKDKSLLTEALTHSSYAHEVKHNCKFNERMEFLGDAVLSIITAEYLYKKYPDAAEGDLTKVRSSLVNTDALYEYAKSVDLNRYLIMGKGASQRHDEDKPTVLENAFEALIAAIYLDGGMSKAKNFVLPFLKSEVRVHRSSFRDYKSLFQIIIQQNPDERFQYKLVDEFGPDHDKRYVVELYVNSNLVGKGEASSKKGAEQEAAREALELMGVEI
ncbi:MAG: ribonuclease III [Eubacterium sp.]|nr:ribonuclease III [Eubacterium sp.]